MVVRADQYSGLSSRPEHTDRQIQRLRDPLLDLKLRPNLMGRDVSVLYLFCICGVRWLDVQVLYPNHDVQVQPLDMMLVCHWDLPQSNP